MHYLQIADDQYGSDELSKIVSMGLSALGVDSYQTINIDTKKNRISIGFTSQEDANVARAIAGFIKRPKTKTFKSRDARGFLLELYTLPVTEDIN